MVSQPVGCEAAAGPRIFAGREVSEPRLEMSAFESGRFFLAMIGFGYQPTDRFAPHRADAKLLIFASTTVVLT